jgi:predicted MFS family arabinose efflux permease
MWVVKTQVPDAPPPRPRTAASAGTTREAVLHPELLRLNAGIFILHVVLYAMFVVVPPLMVQAGLELSGHWKLYLPVVLVSFLAMVPPILYVDRRNAPKPVLVGAVLLLTAVEAALGLMGSGLTTLAALMLGFFIAFNVLEALLPSLVSRIAPAEGRGVAIGVYNTTQTLGVALGGALGGAVAKHYGATAVFGLCAVLAAVWLLIAIGMRPVPRPVNGLSKAAL